MENENPFAAPISEGEATAKPSVPSRVDENSLSAIAVPIFIAWEKLRLIYIAVLIVASVSAALLNDQFIYTFEFWAGAIFGAVVTNVFYFAGPVVETYLSWLKIKPQGLRVGLFVVGTIFSTIVAMLAVYDLASSIPN